MKYCVTAQYCLSDRIWMQLIHVYFSQRTKFIGLIGILTHTHWVTILYGIPTALFQSKGWIKGLHTDFIKIFSSRMSYTSKHPAGYLLESSNSTTLELEGFEALATRGLRRKCFSKNVQHQFLQVEFKKSGLSWALFAVEDWCWLLQNYPSNNVAYVQ